MYLEAALEIVVSQEAREGMKQAEEVFASAAAAEPWEEMAPLGWNTMAATALSVYLTTGPQD